jgi:hypothetical protein
MRVVDILNYIAYNRALAIEILQNEVGFKDYGKKHYESQFTKFFQGYYLPTKFGYDKRRAHLSSLILSEQITRQNALKEIDNGTYPADLIKADKEFVQKKLGLSEKTFSDILLSPNRSFNDYPTSDKLRMRLSKVKGLLRHLNLRRAT